MAFSLKRITQFTLYLATIGLKRLVAAVFRLCEVERRAVDVNLIHLLSPEVGSTLMWFLRRWSLSYLLPVERLYSEMSMALLTAFGKDTEGALWTMNFLLGKIESNLRSFYCETGLIKDTIQLLIALCDMKEKIFPINLYPSSTHIHLVMEAVVLLPSFGPSINRLDRRLPLYAEGSCVVKSDCLLNIIKLQSTMEQGALPQVAKRGLFKALVLVGSAVESQARADYWAQILKPLQDRFKSLICQENFTKLLHEERVKMEIIDILESFIGVSQGSQISTVQSLFQFLYPMLSEFSTLIGMYHNYQVVVELILELYCECARNMLCYLSQTDSHRIYGACLQTIQTYARCNMGRICVESSAEENSYHDILLLMELLTNLLNKDCIDLGPPGKQDHRRNRCQLEGYETGGSHQLLPTHPLCPTSQQRGCRQCASRHCQRRRPRRPTASGRQFPARPLHETAAWPSTAPLSAPLISLGHAMNKRGRDYEKYIAADDDITVWGNPNDANIIREQQELSGEEGEEEMEEEPEDIHTMKDVPEKEPTEGEITVTAADMCLYGLDIIMPLMTIDLLTFPSLCLQYFKMVTFACEIYPDKVCKLPLNLLKSLLMSLELGLTSFGQDVIILCCDFIQVMGTHIYLYNIRDLPVHDLLRPFLKLLMDLMLTRQINSEILPNCSGALYILISVYQDMYQQLVQSLLDSQQDSVIAARLARAFTDLTANIALDTNRMHRNKFRDNFDKFIATVRSFLVIK
uniref:Exportin-4 n=1 Tax=Timema genevievae TaxID=629358 RepID=A0A7R9PK31_TIMGE|nr:unnamed protein product [Timema genevievae]